MYYIYFWFNVKTNEIFYIGLGTGHRRFHTRQRNKLFMKYYKENECAVRLYKIGLNINEATQLEKDLISELNPCCNISRGGDRTNGEKISKSLTGKVHSKEHRKNVSEAIKKWHKEKVRNGKKVYVLDENRNIIKTFEAKYQLGEWLHRKYDYGINNRSAQRMADKYFKTKELFDERFYFVEKYC